MISQELSCTYLNFLLLILPLNNKNTAVLKAKMPMEQTLAHLCVTVTFTVAETPLQHGCPALGEWMEKCDYGHDAVMTSRHTESDNIQQNGWN